MKTANYPIVVGDVLTAGQDAFRIMDIPAVDTVTVVDVRTDYEYDLPLSIVQAIGTTDPATGTPRV